MLVVGRKEMAHWQQFDIFIHVLHFIHRISIEFRASINPSGEGAWLIWMLPARLQKKNGLCLKQQHTSFPLLWDILDLNKKHVFVAVRKLLVGEAES